MPPLPADPALALASASVSASASENHATLAASVSPPTPTPTAPQQPTKLRSCAVCRRRKVRCDKASPCSNCRHADIPCTYPPDERDRPPRWARRYERLTNADDVVAPAEQQAPAAAASADPQDTVVLERLRTLEGLLKELSGQLKQANAHAATAATAAAASATADGGSRVSSMGRHSPGSGAPGAGTHDERDADRGSGSSPSVTQSQAGIQHQLGRMVLKDANRSRYVSSGFWTRVDVSGIPMFSSMQVNNEDKDAG